MCGLILLFSVLGVLAPVLIVRYGGARALGSFAFQLLQCVAVGLICGVAILHIFADAQEDLSQVSDFPVAGTLLLAGCFTMLAMSRMTSIVAARYASSLQPPQGCHASSVEIVRRDEEDLAGRASTTSGSMSGLSFTAGSLVRPTLIRSSGSFHGHVHQRLLLDPSLGSSIGARMTAYLLEGAIAVHSILVGLGVGLINEGASSHASLEVIILGTAVCFHQFFEGIAVGSQGMRVGLKGQSAAIMILLFAFSCPLGVLLGISIASSLDTESEQARWVLGSLNAFAAGALLEIGCVDLLPEFFSHKHGGDEKISLRGDCARLLALVFGTSAMAVLAIWA